VPSSKKLIVFNGSPRGKEGNTKILVEKFIEGFEANKENSHELFYLRRTQDADRFHQAFANAEQVLLAFPLYTDAMPGLVKDFIELLEPFCGRKNNPGIGFMVHSGFPEATHSRYVERYLEKLAARLDCRYMGTLVKGGSEGVRVMPAKMNRKLFNTLSLLGKAFGETGQFDEALVQKLARPERYRKIQGLLFRLFLKTKLSTFFWDRQLKKNHAYEQRFARPYDK
jgi:NAD(P)H-dependent FMN reductase